MAGLKGITINIPPEAEPHIYAEDDAAIFQTIVGEDGVSNVGQACKATVLSNNKVRVADGVLFVGGHFARIPYGEYVDCEIANGQSGKNRNDIIMARFETTGTGGMDTFTCEVKQGAPGTEATDPEIIQNNLYQGGKVREFPLYRVKIEGLSITAVEQLFKVTPTNKDLTDKIGNLGRSAAIGQYGAQWNITTTYKNVGSSLATIDNDLYETVSGNDAVLKIKKPGTYLLIVSSEFAANTSSAGGTVWSTIFDGSGAQVARGTAYLYGNPTTVKYTHMLKVESAVELSLRASCAGASAGAIRSNGVDLMQCIKIL